MRDAPPEALTASLRFLRPHLTEKFEAGNIDELSAFSGTYDLTLQFPFEAANFVVSLPFGSIHAEISGHPRAANRIGNIYLGVQTKGKSIRGDGVESFSFGMYLPTASERKMVVYNPQRSIRTDTTYVNSLGAVTNPYEEDRFLLGFLTLYANTACEWSLRGGFVAAFEVGPNVLIPVDGGDTTARLHYALAIGNELRRLAFRTELLGHMSYPERWGSDDPFVHFVDFGVRLGGYPIEPAVFYELPIEGRGERPRNGTVGFKVAHTRP